MLNITYTHSFNLLKHLDQIEQLRTALLTIPLNPQRKQEIIWQATLDRTYALLDQTENSASRLTFDQVKRLVSNKVRSDLTPTFRNKQPEEGKQVQSMKKAFDYIKYNWQVVPEKITSKEVIHLHSLFSHGKLKKDKSEIDQLLEYIQVKNERPIVQSGIAYAEMLRLSPFTHDNVPLAHLLAYLFLYKSGYSFLGMLVFENHFKKDEAQFKQKLLEALKSSNLTSWLEYFAQSSLSQLENVLKTTTQPESPSAPQRLENHLTDRQKEILALFEEPEIVITNKKVQQMFKVSQITASRDLAKLAGLGLIISGGKGRSIHYTKFPQS